MNTFATSYTGHVLQPILAPSELIVYRVSINLSQIFLTQEPVPIEYFRWPHGAKQRMWKCLTLSLKLTKAQTRTGCNAPPQFPIVLLHVFWYIQQTLSRISYTEFIVHVHIINASACWWIAWLHEHLLCTSNTTSCLEVQQSLTLEAFFNLGTSIY